VAELEDYLRDAGQREAGHDLGADGRRFQRLGVQAGEDPPAGGVEQQPVQRLPSADLTAWNRLLGFHDCADLKKAEPGTLRYRVWHLPARIVHHARQRILKISPDWPWKQAFLTC
jgi:hypothetical protein